MACSARMGTTPRADSTDRLEQPCERLDDPPRLDAQGDDALAAFGVDEPTAGAGDPGAEEAESAQAGLAEPRQCWGVGVGEGVGVADRLLAEVGLGEDQGH